MYTLLHIAKNASFKTPGNVLVAKVFSTHGVFFIRKASFPLSTLWLIQWRDSNRTATLNSHMTSLDLNPWSSIHPILNETNYLGGIEVVRFKEWVSVGHWVWWVFTTDWLFKKISDWKTTFATLFNCFNKSHLDEVTVLDQIHPNPAEGIIVHIHWQN